MSVKPVVLRSVEEPGGARCVDVLRDGSGFGWVECRRDPEDGHGWRRVGEVAGGFASETAALADARASVGWMGEP
jgi:hypothetical protein